MLASQTVIRSSPHSDGLSTIDGQHRTSREAGGVSRKIECGTNDFLRLLEENSRLRKLAVKLSNLLGDLPASAASEIEPRPLIDP